MKAIRKASVPKKLRVQAEKLLATTRREVAQMPVDDVQKLVHELQVHQIELEMQNDELRRTQLELEAARERLRLPYDAAPVGFLALDVRGVILEANLAAARLLNFDRVRLPGQKLTHFIAPESQDIFYLCRRQLLNTGEKQACELHLLRTGEPLFIARLEIVVDGVGLEPGTRCLAMVSDITEQKLAAEALAQSERRERERAQELAVLIDAIPTPVMIVHDRDSRHITGNRAADELLRVSRGAEVSMSAPKELKPVHFKSVKNGRELGLEELPAQRAARGETVRDFEFNLVFTDGTVCNLLGYGTPLLDERGHPRGAVHTLVDITARKQMEESLRQAHDKLEQHVRERTAELTRANTALRGEKAFSDSLIELAPAVIAVVDGQGNLIRTNAYAEQLTGYPFAETEGRNMIEMFVPAEAQPSIRNLLQAALQGAVMPSVVAPLRTRDGHIRQIEWLSKPLINAAGRLTALLAIGHDITERKEAEAALRRSERHLSNFFDQAPIGLLWLSASGIILRANQAQLDMVGCPAKNFLGQSFNKYIAEPAQGYELLQWLANRETVRNFRISLRSKNGGIRQVLVDANSFWSGNRFEYSSVFLRDITDRINLEREILHISEREHRRIAQDLHDGLGQLLVGAAYLVGTVRQDLAAKRLPEARKLGRIGEVINEAVAQSRNLARGLHPVEPEPNGLMAALETLAIRTKKLFQVRCRFTCRRPILISDNTVATHLFRIAQEAVTNAIKHGKPGRIEISLTRTPGRINLAVKDDGSGMPARQRKNGGMGLRIMRYRAGMIGGSLAIQKEADGGTTVVCTVHQSDEDGPKRKRQTVRGKKRRKE